MSWKQLRRDSMLKSPWFEEMSETGCILRWLNLGMENCLVISIDIHLYPGLWLLFSNYINIFVFYCYVWFPEANGDIKPSSVPDWTTGQRTFSVGSDSLDQGGTAVFFGDEIRNHFFDQDKSVSGDGSKPFVYQISGNQHSFTSLFWVHRDS